MINIRKWRKFNEVCESEASALRIVVSRKSSYFFIQHQNTLKYSGQHYKGKIMVFSSRLATRSITHWQTRCRLLRNICWSGGDMMPGNYFSRARNLKTGRVICKNAPGNGLSDRSMRVVTRAEVSVRTLALRWIACDNSLILWTGCPQNYHRNLSLQQTSERMIGN